MKKQRYPWIFVLGAFLGLLGSYFNDAIAAAATDFPKKEVTIIVNFGAGGARDTLARGAAKTMSKYLGVPVIVVNMPGAGGARGLIQLYQSPPDGHTLAIGCNTDLISSIVEPQEYDSRKFTYIGRAQSSPLFFWVRSDSALRSLKDFKTFGKPVRHATHSLTSPSTVAPMVLANREGFPLVIVAGYQGGAAADLALLRGEVEFTGNPLSTALPHFRSGQIRPVLTIGPKRSPVFPDIPTVGEEGHEDLASLALEYWFMAPPGVPKSRVQTVEDALVKTLKDPEFVEWAKGAGVDIAPANSDETTKMIFDLCKLLERYKGDMLKYIKK